MHHVITRSQDLANLAVSSLVAVAAAIAAVLLGSGGAVLLLGPEGTEDAGISFAA